MDPYVGEVRSFAFGVVPSGWLPCDGRLLPIKGNVALYSILGTQYGGDGQTSFALPDLRGTAAAGSQPGAAGGGSVGYLVTSFCIAVTGVFPTRGS